MREQVKFWQTSELSDSFDVLRATYITHTFARHTHEGFAIGVIERGAETYTYRGGFHAAAAGSLVVINPGEMHTGEAGTPEGWTYRMIYPSADLLRRIATQISGREQDVPFFSQTVIRDAELFAAFRAAHISLEASPSRLENETRLLWTLARLVERHADGRLARAPLTAADAAVEQARAYIHTHYAEDVALETLAAQVHLSPFHLSRLFHQRTGLPPHAYLTQVRVERARMLLKAGLTPAWVAQETGFAHQSHLTRAFKRIVGVPPGHYGRIVRNG
jgi:AraC-like DNA-binding protein